LIEVPMRDSGFDLDAIASAIDHNTRLVFIANPNNPTGTLVGPDALDRFLERVPEHVIVILDEAYCDFAQHFATARGTEYSRSLDYVRDGLKVVVLRTFSKAHGLAGVRIGYGLGPGELMSYFARMRTTFSVSSVAQAAALAALEDGEHIRRAVVNNAEQADWLVRRLAELGYRVLPTWGNFVYCELGEDAAAVARNLQNEGVIIRPLGPWGAPTAIRITIGTPEQNQTFLKAFKKVMEKAAVR
jgi:histidinol-phosphate aminotransferase